MKGRLGTRLALVATVGAGSVALSACGSDDYARNPGPPVPIQLTGVIREEKVQVQPHRVGAGPIIIIVSNQTERSHTVTLEGPGLAPTRVGPIHPLDTAEIQKTLEQGEYTVTANSSREGGGEIKPAELIVGPPRPSRKNKPLLP